MIGSMPTQLIARYRGYAPPRLVPPPVYHAPVPYRPPSYGVLPGTAERERQRQAALQIQQQRQQLQQQRLQLEQQQFAQQQAAFAARSAQQAALPLTYAPPLTVATLPTPQPAVSPAAPTADLTPAQDANAPEPTAEDKPHRGKKLFLFAGIAVAAAGIGYMVLRKKKSAAK